MVITAVNYGCVGDNHQHLVVSAEMKVTVKVCIRSLYAGLGIAATVYFIRAVSLIINVHIYFNYVCTCYILLIKGEAAYFEAWWLCVIRGACRKGGLY